ncbi:hypothetical protein F3Y22_tig00110482pilonHSYRG00467 [Hibiscus syriacus]|uniref:C3H1-type domain-containing protein n=1 Tax=Hibiscus syriacus TaxID=106335 RepID=A0A6A3ADH7_HIBSY|nr:hypothetical protein F3Y22_tig00110482pilonHSYRG00467 [Hibiscus syriacus]
MDGYEATRIVLSRIQSLEPENASRIMGLLLIQDHGEKEMIRLAFGPEALLHSLILKAKKDLGLPTNPSSLISRQSSCSSRLLGSTTGMVDEFQLQDQLSFLNESSQNHDLFYTQAPELSSDVLGADDPASGLWWRHCLCFARGYCKNGNNCIFIHGGVGETGSVAAAEGDNNIVGSPNKIEMMDQCHELLGSKSARQQRLTATSQLIGSPPFPYSPKCMKLVLQ